MRKTILPGKKEVEDFFLKFYIKEKLEFFLSFYRTEQKKLFIIILKFIFLYFNDIRKLEVLAL